MTLLDFGDSSHIYYTWDSQSIMYKEYREHFDGTWLNEKTGDSDVLKYPLQYNVFVLPVTMHTSFLFGEVPDGASSMITPEVEIWKNGEKSLTQESIKLSQRMTQFLGQVWSENNGRSKLAQAALDAQIYGGAVLGAFYAPERQNDGYAEVMITSMDPDFFYPIWSHNDYDRLIKAIVAYGITRDQAEEIGLSIDTEVCTYVEKWTRNGYEITVDDKVLYAYGNKMSGRPVAGRIPYVYVPHPPRVGFYGTSLLKNKMPMAREINTRMTDIGDIIASEAMNIPSIINVRNAEIKWISKVKPVMDLGFSQGDRKPEMQHPTARASSTQTSSEYLEKLIDNARSEAYTPPVIYGKGSGSQRSAATLAMEAIPLVAHIRDERAAFTSSLAELNKTILMIAAEKNMANFGIDVARQAVVRTNWYPMMPRDVLEEVTSIINRVQAEILSRETAIEKIGDVLDIQGEIDKIKAWTKSEEKQEPNPFAGTGNNGELAGLQSLKGVDNNGRYEPGRADANTEPTGSGNSGSNRRQ